MTDRRTIPGAPSVEPNAEDLSTVPKLSRFDEFLTEQQVCERYALFVGQRELRKARRNGEIAFVPGKKGVPLYHPDAIAAYLDSKEVKCRERNPPRESSSNSGDIGSGVPTAPPSSTPTGMTEEADRLLEDHLAQKYSKRQKPV
jgi:hypothetical protein